jgi:hypothetical protein
MKYFREFNFNPWGANVDDCAIRAIVAALGMDYRVVCKTLGVSWKHGKGLIRDSGIDLDLIKQKFDSYFDIVEDFADTYEIPQELIDDPEFDNSIFFSGDLADGDFGVSGLTLEEFIDMYKNQGRFLVGLSPNPNAKNETARSGGHIVMVNC